MILLLFLLPVKVYFSPNGGCKAAVVNEIKGAEKYFYGAIYVFTDREIAQELINAKKRGVDVRIVMDGKSASEISYSKHIFLKRNGVNVRLLFKKKRKNQKYSGIMHDKFAIIDGKVVLTGSFNWTPTAEKSNDENLVIINDNDIARIYKKRFSKLYNSARPVNLSQKIINGNNPREVKKHTGEYCIVEGKVYNYNISHSGNLFVDFGSKRSAFTFVMWNEGVRELKKRNFPFEKLLNGRVRVRGKIIDHPKYGLEITTEDPDAIEIIK